MSTPEGREGAEIVMARMEAESGGSIEWALYPSSLPPSWGRKSRHMEYDLEERN